MAHLHPAQTELRKFASKSRVLASQRFFKTGPGSYGEGDIFIGCSVPDTRRVAREFSDIDLSDVVQILSSPIHEDRLLALLMLVSRYQASRSVSERAMVVRTYLRRRRFVNNWDLVDTSAYKILGDHCVQNQDQMALHRLIVSRRHWDRRIAMVASYAFIKVGQLDICFSLAAQLMRDPQDLMHKASGWMLREAGKRDRTKLLKFIDRYGEKMPRTMLRYAIEKFTADERMRILKNTKRVLGS